MKATRIGLGVVLAACLVLAGGCAGPSGKALTAQDIGISLALAQQDKDGFPHAFRITLENKSDHEGILPLHGALPTREGFIPPSIWLGFKTADGRDVTLTYTYGTKPKGERVRLKAGEKLVREYPAAEFCLWGPAADTGPNPDYAFGRYFKPGEKELQVQAAYIVEPSEEGSAEPATVLSEAVTMRCSYEERDFTRGGAEEEPPGTPLHQAVRRGDAAAVERLLAEGADVNAPDKYNRTPLHVAAKADNAEIAEVLLAKGASLSARDTGENTPLGIAALYGKVEVMKLLIAKGAELDARDPIHGKSPLGTAALNGQLEAAKLLLESGADPNVKDALGDTPLCYAALRGHEKVVALLLDKGADIHARGNNGLTPLHHAAAGGHKNVVELLLARGADPNIKDRSGNTVLGWAEESGTSNRSTMQLLKQHGAKE